MAWHYSAIYSATATVGQQVSYKLPVLSAVSRQLNRPKKPKASHLTESSHTHYSTISHLNLTMSVHGEMTQVSVSHRNTFYIIRSAVATASENIGKMLPILMRWKSFFLWLRKANGRYICPDAVFKPHYIYILFLSGCQGLQLFPLPYDLQWWSWVNTQGLELHCALQTAVTVERGAAGPVARSDCLWQTMNRWQAVRHCLLNGLYPLVHCTAEPERLNRSFCLMCFLRALPFVSYFNSASF